MSKMLWSLHRCLMSAEVAIIESKAARVISISRYVISELMYVVGKCET